MKEKLIIGVFSHPILYDWRFCGNGDAGLRNKAWREVEQVVGEPGINYICGHSQKKSTKNKEVQRTTNRKSFDWFFLQRWLRQLELPKAPAQSHCSERRHHWEYLMALVNKDTGNYDCLCFSCHCFVFLHNVISAFQDFSSVLSRSPWLAAQKDQPCIHQDSLSKTEQENDYPAVRPYAPITNFLVMMQS